MNELFNDVSVLTEEQQEDIDTIEKHAEETHELTKESVKELKRVRASFVVVADAAGGKIAAGSKEENADYLCHYHNHYLYRSWRRRRHLLCSAEMSVY